MSRYPIAGLCLALGLTACGGQGPGSGAVQRVTVPAGAAFSQVADTLEARGLVDSPRLLRLYARATGAAEAIQADQRSSLKRGETGSRIARHAASVDWLRACFGHILGPKLVC